MRIGDRRQWYFTVTVRIPEVKHKVRIVILWRYRHDPEPVKILVTNRTTWEVSRIVRVYRHRWMGTETFHRDGKQQLGLGACQLRDLQGQTWHVYLVMSWPSWDYPDLQNSSEKMRSILQLRARCQAIRQAREKPRPRRDTNEQGLVHTRPNREQSSIIQHDTRDV